LLGRRREEDLVRGPGALLDLDQAVHRVLERALQSRDGRVVKQEPPGDAEVVHGDPLGANGFAHERAALRRDDLKLQQHGSEHKQQQRRRRPEQRVAGRRDGLHLRAWEPPGERDV
jgi:hypothetical protein